MFSEFVLVKHFWSCQIIEPKHIDFSYDISVTFVIDDTTVNLL